MLLFIVCMVLFLGGIYLFGLAFAVDSWQALIFIAGLAAVSLAMIIPIHILGHGRSSGRKAK